MTGTRKAAKKRPEQQKSSEQRRQQQQSTHRSGGAPLRPRPGRRGPPACRRPRAVALSGRSPRLRGAPTSTARPWARREAPRREPAWQRAPKQARRLPPVFFFFFFLKTRGKEFVRASCCPDRAQGKASPVDQSNKVAKKQKLLSRPRASRRRPWSVLLPSRRRRGRERGRIEPRPSQPYRRRRPCRPLLRLRWAFERNQRGRPPTLPASLRRAQTARPPRRRKEEIEEEQQRALTFFSMPPVELVFSFFFSPSLSSRSRLLSLFLQRQQRVVKRDVNIRNAA